jgi:hypothetical protein
MFNARVHVPVTKLIQIPPQKEKLLRAIKGLVTPNLGVTKEIVS